MVSCLATADTSKAFDSVQHGRLLDKLGWYGVDTHWFSDWLQDRHQRVRGGSVETVPITHGVVQGSILGPVLFLLFTNDLTSFISDAKLVLYADDVQLIHSDNPLHMSDLEHQIGQTLSRAQRRFVGNSLKINPTKTELVLLATRQRRVNTDFQVQFGDVMLHPTSSAKILGFILDSNLTFEKHISVVVQRCYATLSDLAKFSRRLPLQVKKLIIEALVFPHIMYCATVWAGCNKTQRKRVQKIINYGARIVKCCRRHERVTPHLTELEWPRVDRLVTERDLVMMHRLLNSAHAPACLRNLLQYRECVSVRETRGSLAGQLQLPRVRTELARRSFGFRAVTCWNGAPGDMRGAGTVKAFHTQMQKWLTLSAGKWIRWCGGMWVCACVSVLFLLLNCDVRVFYSFIFSIGIFSIYILSSCNLTLVLKSRVHTDAIRIHDDDGDDDLPGDLRWPWPLLSVLW